MPKRAKELSAVEVKRLTRPGLHAVGGVAGLHLRVTDSGARHWILRVKSGNRRRDFGLGGYPEVPLSQAREDAREIKLAIRHGRDPIAERKAAVAALKAEQARELSFADAARRCHKAKSAEFKSPKHAKLWLSSLERHAFPVIGNMPVSEIALPQVLKVLEPIWLEKPETASRVRQRMETVMTWATVSRHREGENPCRWDGNLREVLPNHSRTRKVQHFPALPWQRVPAFLAALQGEQGMGARALELITYTATRSGEVRGATWAEIDLEARLWTISGDRMKGGKPHKVPLNEAAVALLSGLPKFPESDHVFTAARGGPISDMTISATLRRMHKASVEKGGEGWTEPATGRVAVPHGMRSSFKDWCRSRTAYPDEVSELQLAHVNDDKTRAAYARDELLPQRFRLMDEWGRFLREGLPEGDVASIREHSNG